MRIRCELFGCMADKDSCCVRCDEHVYQGDFIQRGHWLCELALRMFNRLRSPLKFRRCAVCDKRFWSTYGEVCCSKQCDREWIPF